MSEQAVPNEELKEAAADSKRQDPGDDKIVFKRSHLYAVLLPLAFVVGLSVGYLFWGRGSETASQAPQAAAAQPAVAQQAAQATPAFKRYDVPVDDDPAIGPEDAPITLIEFSDFECPYCRRWHEEVYGRIREEYSDEVRIVFRDFPLTSIHPNAIPAAEAANCAGEQDKYWEYHNLLFSGEDVSQNVYLDYAEELALDIEAFEECRESGRHEDEVMADYQYAAGLGVRSTPTFFLNGIPIVGAQPYDVFKEVIDKELAGEFP
jgi:protein-disulfide isomerase